MSYNHLSLEQRHYINISLKKGMSLSDIAIDLERSQSTIRRAVNRNKSQRGLHWYRYQQVNSKALQSHKVKHNHVKLTAVTDSQ